MRPITILNDEACVRGTFISILTDSGILTDSAQKIITEINQRTEGNVTKIGPEEVKFIMRDIFTKWASAEVKIPNDFQALERINNVTSFGILFWLGNANGNNRHATRLVCIGDNNLTVVDTTFGQIISCDFEKIFEISPCGFYFIKMEK